MSQYDWGLLLCLYVFCMLRSSKQRPMAIVIMMISVITALLYLSVFYDVVTTTMTCGQCNNDRLSLYQSLLQSPVVIILH